MARLLGPDGKPVKLDAVKEVDINETRMVERDGYLMPWPLNHMEPYGDLAATMAAAASWRFMYIAHAVVRDVPDQVVVEGDDDVAVSLKDVAKSVGITYGVTPAEMFTPENLRRLRSEAARSKQGIDRRVDAFLSSGGQLYAKYDREPNA